MSCKYIKVSTCLHGWLDEVVPLTMKRVRFQVHALHLFIAHFAPGWVFAPIQPTGDCQSFRRGGPGDKIDDIGRVWGQA